MTRSPVQRFFEKIDKTETCWLWVAALDKGYGRFAADGRRMISAHRWSYEFHVGPIPEGLTLDHLCRTPRCVNPDHLEPVTQRENMARIPPKTHCPHGHPFTTANTYIRTASRQDLRPARQCRTCARLAARVRYAAARSDSVA